jgi:hypothetical protein
VAGFVRENIETMIRKESNSSNKLVEKIDDVDASFPLHQLEPRLSCISPGRSCLAASEFHAVDAKSHTFYQCNDVNEKFISIDKDTGSKKERKKERKKETNKQRSQQQ